MSTAHVYGYIVDLYRTDRPGVVELVIHASAEGEAKAGITGRNAYALTENACLRAAAAMGNTHQKVGKGHKIV